MRSVGLNGAGATVDLCFTKKKKLSNNNFLIIFKYGIYRNRPYCLIY